VSGNWPAWFGSAAAGKGPAARRAPRQRPTGVQASGQGPRRQTRHDTPLPGPPEAARTIAALLALRDQVIAPILADVRSPRLGRKPAHWTRIDRDYETLRTGIQTLFHDLGISVGPAAA
jgi:hypothetical protein